MLGDEMLAIVNNCRHYLWPLVPYKKCPAKEVTIISNLQIITAQNLVTYCLGHRTIFICDGDPVLPIFTPTGRTEPQP